ncbi:MAG: transcription elongation factor GreA [Eubacteriales bacterium]|nr:transcription elongation factor GreA [Christensenellaceae bacterium]MEA5066407.1 transcription elongation factor GreA [Eubacteriales bacterium]
MAEASSFNRVVLTPDGKRKLEEELNELKTVKRVEVAKDIEVARSFGDLSENAEYDEAKNEQARIEGRIRQLEEMLRNAEVVDESEIRSDVVGVGSAVRVFDMEYDEEDTYTLVGATEAEPAKLRVSAESPIGQALLGSKVNAVVEAQTPGGLVKFKVLEISRAK